MFLDDAGEAFSCHCCPWPPWAVLGDTLHDELSWRGRQSCGEVEGTSEVGDSRIPAGVTEESI